MLGCSADTVKVLAEKRKGGRQDAHGRRSGDGGEESSAGGKNARALGMADCSSPGALTRRGSGTQEIGKAKVIIKCEAKHFGERAVREGSLNVVFLEDLATELTDHDIFFG